MISLRNPALMDVHHAAGMVTPDGMPLVWISKWRSKLPVKRVCGADLVDALCNDGQSSGLRHYFYGGKPGIAESMIRNLKAKYPDLVVAGFYAPPFRSLTEEEDAAIVDAINKSGAQVVWIGLSTPNQEFWTRDHVGQINGATLIGVGAAFDFHSGAVTRAPKWMQKSGFEWLHRLLSEPRRLWRRYLVIAPSFVVNIVREEIGFRTREKEAAEQSCRCRAPRLGLSRPYSFIAREKSSVDVHRDEVGALPKRRCFSQPRVIIAGLLATAIEKRRAAGFFSSSTLIHPATDLSCGHILSCGHLLISPLVGAHSGGVLVEMAFGRR